MTLGEPVGRRGAGSVRMWFRGASALSAVIALTAIPGAGTTAAATAERVPVGVASASGAGSLTGPPTSPRTGSAPGTSIAPRVLTALPGFRRTPDGPVLDEARFTSVAVLPLPAAPSARTVVVHASVRVAVPVRLALSVRAWCDPRRSLSAPDARIPRDVLVIGQNPVPGGTPEQVASRTLSGRAVVDLPAGQALWCVVQVSPRTETTSPSAIRLLAGHLLVDPVAVIGRAAQRPALLVGAAGAGGWPASAGPPVPVRPVAGVGPLPFTGAVRFEGEAELTTCAFGYHLCGRGRAPRSVVEVRLVVRDIAPGGAACRVWYGSVRRVGITPAVHHVKVPAPATTVTARCGVAVQGHLQVVHRGGNAVEIEPTLVPRGAVLVQTHTWFAGA